MKTNMMRTGITVAALLALPFTALAADLPRQPSYKAAPGYAPAPVYATWSGFYLGLNAGYGFGESDWQNPAVSMEPTGAVVGGTIGYNLQTGTWVWGLEADIAWSGMKDDIACGGGTCSTEAKWFGTARGRLGYAGWNNWLPYLTAGAAFAGVEASNTVAGSASETMIGWTVGLGLEYAFMGNWSLKGEYLYADLGNMDCPTCNVAGAANEVSYTTNIVRAGLNYRF